jgi:hypothetical protein
MTRSDRFVAVPFTICAALTLAGCADNKQPGARGARSDWRPLPLTQNGKVHPAWHQTGWGGFVAEDGMLRTAPDEKGLGMLLYTKEEFGDCQVRVVFKADKPTANSGVFVRVDDGMLRRLDEKSEPASRDQTGQLTPEGAKAMQEASEKQLGAWYAVHHGYEVQIADGGDPFHRTGAVYSLAPSALTPSPSGAGTWRTMVITLRGNVVEVEVDGQHTATLDPDSKDVPPRKVWHEPDRGPKRPTHGYIGLQNHDPGDIVHFKEVSIRPLNGGR